MGVLITDFMLRRYSQMAYERISRAEEYENDPELGPIIRKSEGDNVVPLITVFYYYDSEVYPQNYITQLPSDLPDYL